MALFASEKKRKYHQHLKDPNKHVWNEKRSDIFSDLTEEPNDSNNFKNACKFITRCVELEEWGKFKIEGNCSKNHFRAAGAGAPTKL